MQAINRLPIWMLALERRAGAAFGLLMSLTVIPGTRIDKGESTPPRHFSPDPTQPTSVRADRAGVLFYLPGSLVVLRLARAPGGPLLARYVAPSGAWAWWPAPCCLRGTVAYLRGHPLRGSEPVRIDANSLNRVSKSGLCRPSRCGEFDRIGTG